MLTCGSCKSYIKLVFNPPKAKVATPAVPVFRARVQTQATPQNAHSTVTTAAAPQPKQAVPDQPISYKPVTADGVKAFFAGIKRQATAELTQPTTPANIVLKPPPVPQILPCKIHAEVSQQAKEYEQREHTILTHLSKLAQCEITRLAQEAKQHPLIPLYMSGLIQPEGGDHSQRLFERDPIDELCQFQIWLETQGADMANQQEAIEQVQTETKDTQMGSGGPATSSPAATQAQTWSLQPNTLELSLTPSQPASLAHTPAMSNPVTPGKGRSLWPIAKHTSPCCNTCCSAKSASTGTSTRPFDIHATQNISPCCSTC